MLILQASLCSLFKFSWVFINKFIVSRQFHMTSIKKRVQFFESWKDFPSSDEKPCFGSQSWELSRQDGSAKFKRKKYNERIDWFSCCMEINALFFKRKSLLFFILFSEVQLKQVFEIVLQPVYYCTVAITCQLNVFSCYKNHANNSY